ncbi:vacuolar protein sorting-associated protein 41 homolog isoform X1 [Styela clava]
MSSDSDIDSESEEEEPQLKYERVRNDLLKILSEDAASCVVMQSKFVALGTHWGKIYILDHNGNKVTSKQFESHNTQVTGISLDEGGEYLASCSDDGKVVVVGLYSDTENISINVDRPVKSVALDPSFSKNSSKQLVYGIDSLILYEKGWLGRSKTTTLHTGEGLVRNIKWKGHLIAWANDWGVKMYDMKQRRRITHIPRSGAGKQNLRPELYPAHIAWKNDSTLLIGWANEIKVCVVRERRSRDLTRDPDKYVEIVYHLPIDFACSGIAPFGTQLVVLGYELQPDEKLEASGSSGKPTNKPSERPQLRILDPDPSGGGYDEMSSDALSIRGYQTYRCNDYSLTHETGEGMLYIVSPKDIVLARRRDKDDHVSWLLECGMYEDALDAVDRFGKELKTHNFLEVGMTYISHLLDEKQYEDAARACVRVLGNDIEQWEKIVDKFATAHQLNTLSPYLPRGDVRLPYRCYELVLQDILRKDHQAFSQLIKDWPGDLYNIAFVANMVQSALDDYPKDTTLLATLARLYALDQRYDRALSIYLKLRHPDTFQLIRKHSLYAALKKNIILLMEFGGNKAVDLLLDNMEHVPIEKVVKELKGYQEYLHMYLHSLFIRDPHIGSKYHSVQLTLYAEFERPKLLPFLKSSNYYALEEALHICEERDYVDETVFLLARMGNASRALSLIIDNDSDVSRAVEFCKEQNEVELWQELIEKSLDKPEFIRDLLNNIGTHVDPVILIRRIPTGLRIPGLKDALVKILQDYSMQTSMWFQCKRILSSDVIKLNKRQHKVHTRAFRVDEDRACDACGLPLMFPTTPGLDTPLIDAFMCHHLFHDDCLPQQNRTSCSICSGQRRRTLDAR